MNTSLCALSSKDPENIIDENLLPIELSVVNASSISLDNISDEVLLYSPKDSRIIPVEKKGLSSIREKTSEYKNDFWIAVWTVKASSRLCFCPQPERNTRENMSNNHSRFFILLIDINVYDLYNKKARYCNR